jgi:thioredoxin reductase
MRERTARVAVVGGGPAGLAAATALRRAGVGQVLVLEREAQAGGIPRHCGHPPFGWREFRRIDTGPVYARRLVAAALAVGVEILTRHSVLAVTPQGLDVATPDGHLAVWAERVLLATGVRESSRAQRLVGGDRPLGVLTTGALQDFIHGEGSLPFRRPLVVGSELVSLSAVLTLRRAGAQPVALVEEGEQLTARWPLTFYPRVAGVPVLKGMQVMEIRGTRRVEGVLLRDAAGEERELRCDGVLFTGDFRPAAELVRQSHLSLDPLSQGPAVDQFGRCSDPKVFAAGNLLRAVETAGWCWEEGGRVGDAIARDLAHGLPDPAGPLALRSTGDLAFVVPHRIVRGEAPPALRRLQLRARVAVRGTLSASLDGLPLWQRRQALRPQRRLLLPLPAVPRGANELCLALKGD